MIEPTVGRVVWFQVSSDSVELPAIVAVVKEANIVDLVVFGEQGLPVTYEPDVPLMQEESDPSHFVTRYCRWMPYQQKAAAKYPV